MAVEVLESLKQVAAQLGQTVKLHSSVFILTDRNVWDHYGQWLLESYPREDIYILEPGEGSKSLHAASVISDWLISRKVSRDSLIINVGGGVVSDLGGFVASIIKRGISFVHVPTSLMAQVDAAHGGKNGVNQAGLKNALGTFSVPEAVIVSPEFLKTLPDRELLSGFAEMVKHALIYDADYLAAIAEYDLGERQLEGLGALIERSIGIKCEIVAKDPHEHDERRLLNFGHTVGHAVESLSLNGDANPITHGEAVAIGMSIEARLSVEVGLSGQEVVVHTRDALTRLGLPVYHPLLIDTEALLSLIEGDKKAKAGDVRWTLLRGIGQGVSGVSVAAKQLLSAIQSCRLELSA